jgi:DNA-binding GntR family transcriptional regulator
VRGQVVSNRVIALKPKHPLKGRKSRSKASTLDVLQIMRERIARQDIAPGAKLREHELSDEFCVPRARIREVFGALESRGLIERIPNRGAVVSRLELEQVFHLYDVRAVLEGLCVRSATQNAPSETWQEFVDLFGTPMDAFVKAGDFDAFLASYEKFRRKFIECARNPVAAQMLDSIYEKTHVVIRRIVILPNRAQTGLSEHRATVAAMRAGDAEAAERLKRANLQGAKDYLRRFQKYVL